MKTLRLFLAREHWSEIGFIILVAVAISAFKIGVISTNYIIVAIFLGLYPLVKAALQAIWRDHKIGTELFISIAVIVSVIGQEYLAGALILMIILFAEYIASVSSERARTSIRDLIGQAPKTAILKKDGHESTVAISELKVDDIVLVRAGDKIPVDGVVVNGDAAVNQAPITGENMPAEKTIGTTVYAGTIVENGALDIQVQKLAENTVFARIIALVEEAENKQAPIQKLTDRVAAWLIPIVFIFIGLVYFFTRDIKLIIALLIFTSPAELGLATPLVTISAIARAAREGILVKGGLYLEVLANIDTFVFDKTGTLTIGKPTVNRTEILSDSITETEAIRFAAIADKRSSHPLAQAIISLAEKKKITLTEPSSFEVLKGRGIKTIIENKTVLLGNATLLTEAGLAVPPVSSSGIETMVFLAINQTVAAVFHISDVIRPKAKESLQQLRDSGVKKIIILTGDNAETAQFIGSQLAVTNVRANLMPEDKITIIKQIQAEGHLVAMVGDGINDAPALAQADVSIAMGAIGTEAAMEAASIVLMNDDLAKINQARLISRTAYRTIKQNIFVGIGVVHITGITLVLLGIIGPIQAATIHLVPDFLVFLNSIKLLKVKIKD